MECVKHFFPEYVHFTPMFILPRSTLVCPTKPSSDCSPGIPTDASATLIGINSSVSTSGACCERYFVV